MPSFFIRSSNVLRFTPSRNAAPFGPLMRPLVSRRHLDDPRLLFEIAYNFDCIYSAALSLPATKPIENTASRQDY